MNRGPINPPGMADLLQPAKKVVRRSNTQPKQWLLGTGDVFRFAGINHIIRSIDLAESTALLERINREAWPLEFIKVPLDNSELPPEMPKAFIDGTALYRQCLDLAEFKSVLERQVVYVRSRLKNGKAKKRLLHRLENQLKSA